MNSTAKSVEAFLEPLVSYPPNQLKMIPVGNESLMRELHTLEGVELYADVGDRVEDSDIIDGEMFEECLAEGVWIHPNSGEEVPAGRVVFYADLEEAARRGLHGLGSNPSPSTARS